MVIQSQAEKRIHWMQKKLDREIQIKADALQKLSMLSNQQHSDGAIAVLRSVDTAGMSKWKEQYAVCFEAFRVAIRENQQLRARMRDMGVEPPRSYSNVGRRVEPTPATGSRTSEVHNILIPMHPSDVAATASRASMDKRQSFTARMMETRALSPFASSSSPSAAFSNAKSIQSNEVISLNSGGQSKRGRRRPRSAFPAGSRPRGKGRDAVVSTALLTRPVSASIGSSKHKSAIGSQDSSISGDDGYREAGNERSSRLIEKQALQRQVQAQRHNKQSVRGGVEGRRRRPMSALGPRRTVTFTQNLQRGHDLGQALGRRGMGRRRPRTANSTRRVNSASSGKYGYKRVKPPSLGITG